METKGLTAPIVKGGVSLKSAETEDSTIVTSATTGESYPLNQKLIMEKVEKLLDSLIGPYTTRVLRIPCTIDICGNREKSRRTLSLKWNHTGGLTHWSFTSRPMDSVPLAPFSSKGGAS